MSFSHICIIALLATGVASSDSCDANDQACVEDDGPDLSELLQRAASVNKGEQNSIGMQQATIDPIHCGDDQMMCPGPPPILHCEAAACHTAETCMPITFTETVGDCRYAHDSESHGEYQKIENQTSLQACLNSCALDFRCHALDTSSDFGDLNTCWLFENQAGDHRGDSAESSRCYIKEPVCPPPANTGFTEVFTADTCMTITFTETVGDCRYDSDAHMNYKTIPNEKSLQACLKICAADFRCHALDTSKDFGDSNTCWLFANEAGDHTGNGAESSRCYIKGQSC